MFCSFLSRRSDEPVQRLLADGRAHLAAIQTLRAELREFNAYWVAFRNACNSIDELQQCKMRVRRPGELLATIASVRFNQPYCDPRDAPDKLWFIEREVADSRRQLAHECGTLKYLQRLQRDHAAGAAVVEECPICDLLPKGRYAVLLCGHPVCVQCLGRHVQIELRKYGDELQHTLQSVEIQCTQCRLRQWSTE